MTEALSSLLHIVAVSVGGALIALGTLFSGSLGMNVETVATSSPVENVLEVEEVPSQRTKSEVTRSSITPVSSNPAASSGAPGQGISNTNNQATLQIDDIKMSVDDEKATISWTTTLPSESRLIFDNGKGRVFESESGISTNHVIHVSNIAINSEHDFQVLAKTPDKSQEDDYYDTLYGEREYTYSATIEADTGECYEIEVEDNFGDRAANKTVTVRASSGGYPKGNIIVTTSSNGEAKFCSEGGTFRITGENLDITLSAPLD